ncbi:F-box protein CPR1-like [Silene latifolia]|uniref:F-box protein CPR1-like n=1 Tax=Silene latifolia TaxID=37657 RepID=UPI003D784B6A
MAGVPIAIIETNILPRLPAESLPNFKLVCKSFNVLISSPEFMEEHCKRSISTNTGRLVILNTNRGFHVFNYDSLDSPPFYLPFPDNFSRRVYIFGSSNGLMCLGNRNAGSMYSYYDLMLLNPLTGMFFKVPSPEITVTWAIESYGFGFDDWTKDYKIARILETHESRSVMVYSLHANSWKTVMSDSHQKSDELKPHDNGTLINNHLLHWIFTDYVQDHPNNRIENNSRIGCFDLRTDEWVDNVGLPHDFDSTPGCYNQCETLGVFDGRLCLLTRSRLEPHLTCVDMWVMMKYGVRDSWVKLLGVSDSCVTSSLQICPLGMAYGSKHDMLLVRGTKHTIPGANRVVLIWYNMHQKKSRLSQVHKVHNLPQQFYDVCTCIKTLVPLPRDTRIRKTPPPLPEKQPSTLEIFSHSRY